MKLLNCMKKHGVMITAIFAIILLVVWFFEQIISAFLVDWLKKHGYLVPDIAAGYLAIAGTIILVLVLVAVVWWAGFVSGRCSAPHAGYVRSRYWGELWLFRLPFHLEYRSEAPYFECKNTYRTKSGEIYNSFKICLGLVHQGKKTLRVNETAITLLGDNNVDYRLRILGLSDSETIYPENSALIELATGYSAGMKKYSCAQITEIDENTKNTYLQHAERGILIESVSTKPKPNIRLNDKNRLVLRITIESYPLPFYYLIEVDNNEQKPSVHVLKSGIVPYKL